MSKMKRLTIMLCILLLPVMLAACAATTQKNGRASYTDPDAIFKTAWQYVVYQIDNNQNYQQINGAKITRLELVETYQPASGKAVNIYALEYCMFLDTDYGWVSAAAGLGSPYLFVVNNDGSPQIIGIEFSKDILANGGYGKTAERVIANDEILDFTKQSTDTEPYSQEEINAAMEISRSHYGTTDSNMLINLFSQEEIDAAMKISRSYYATDDNMLINLWYDKVNCLVEVNQYRENSTLYGMAEAAERGDLLFLYCDIYFLNPDFDMLCRERNIILMRDSKDASWEIVDQGY